MPGNSSDFVLDFGEECIGKHRKISIDQPHEVVKCITDNDFEHLKIMSNNSKVISESGHPTWRNYHYRNCKNSKNWKFWNFRPFYYSISGLYLIQTRNGLWFCFIGTNCVRKKLSQPKKFNFCGYKLKQLIFPCFPIHFSPKSNTKSEELPSKELNL